MEQKQKCMRRSEPKKDALTLFLLSQTVQPSIVVVAHLVEVLHFRQCLLGLDKQTYYHKVKTIRWKLNRKRGGIVQQFATGTVITNLSLQQS